MNRLILIILILATAGTGYFIYQKRKTPDVDQLEKLQVAMKEENERLLNTPEAKMIREKDMSAIKERLASPKTEQERVTFLETTIRSLDRNQVRFSQDETQQIYEVALSFISEKAKKFNPKESRSVALAFRVLNKMPFDQMSGETKNKIEELLSTEAPSIYLLTLEHMVTWKPMSERAKQEIRKQFDSKDPNMIVQSLQILQRANDAKSKTELASELFKKVWSINQSARPMALKVLIMNSQVLPGGSVDNFAKQIYQNKGPDWEEPFVFAVENSQNSQTFMPELREIQDMTNNPFVKDRIANLLKRMEGASQ